MPKETKLIIYACPTGVLAQELKQTFKQIERECSVNNAHYYFPHITLCSFFSLADKDNIPLLIQALDESIQTYSPSSSTSTCMQDVKTSY